jgi:hypothetical protein
MAITKKEIQDLLIYGSSHLGPIDGLPVGVTIFQVFLSLKPILKRKLYWETLREAYTMSDNLFIYRHDLKAAFISKEENRDFLMSKKEIKILKNLPDKVKIYRGVTTDEIESNDFGLSWSLNREVAEFFAFKYRRNYDTSSSLKTVVELEVDKNEIIAYFHDRGEEEIIYLSK